MEETVEYKTESHPLSNLKRKKSQLIKLNSNYKSTKVGIR